MRSHSAWAACVATTVVSLASLGAGATFDHHLIARQATSNTSSNGALAYSPPFYPSPWMDGSGDWDDAYEKAKAFVAQLTLLEKVNLTTGVGWQGQGCVGNTGSIPRLNFRSLCLQDAPLGIRRSDYNSAFPAGGTVAASWDRKVWEERGHAMGEEFNDKGVDFALGPAIGPLGRKVLGGRNWEGFSPDPWLSGQAVAKTVIGIQDAGVIATTKHYILNEVEHFRQVGEAQGYGFNINATLSSNIDDKTMHELYLWPFADAVRAGTGAIMCSYQQINNSYGCANSYTLNHLLKGELGFQGLVMSDWQAQHGGVSTSFAGLDLTMPGDTLFNSNRTYWGGNLTLSVINGTVPEWRVDDMATRIMAAYYHVGRDHKQVPVNFDSWTRDVFGYENFYAKKNYGLVNQQIDVRRDHGELIREHASKSTVLLKNVRNTLPLPKKQRLTAVLGEDAETARAGPNACSDRNCANGTLAMGYGSGTADFTSLIDPLTAIQNEVAERNGAIQWVTERFGIRQVEAVARQASVAIVFAGAHAGEGYISIEGNQGDRNNYTFWQNGDAVINATASNCNNTVLVIHGPGAISIDAYVNNPNITAILWAGYPGEQTGNSIVDVLYGRVNPGGKLPFTWGRNLSDYGPDLLRQPNNGENAPQDDFTEGIFIDYRHFDKENIEPTYEFGYGLSYTTFEYSDIQVQQHSPRPYTPNTGLTAPAITYRNSSKDIADYQFPSDLEQLVSYVYPYINGTDAKTASKDGFYGTNYTWPAGATDGSPQPKIRAGGAPGGNPRLYDVLYTVTATIRNTGSIAGDEVAQLYLSGLGAPKILRGFERLTIPPGGQAQFKADLTRRDVSNWNVVTQDWEVTSTEKTVYVGASSRKLPLSAPLPAHKSQ